MPLGLFLLRKPAAAFPVDMERAAPCGPVYILPEQLFQPVYGRMLLAGERSGSLEPVLWRLAELLEEQCGTRTDRLVGVVDPLLSGVLLVTVGISLLSVMLPLLGIMNSIG